MYLHGEIVVEIDNLFFDWPRVPVRDLKTWVLGFLFCTKVLLMSLDFAFYKCIRGKIAKKCDR